MKKVLLTGGSGFLGSRLARSMAETWEVAAPGRGILDCTEEEQIRYIMESFRPDLVIHAAGLTATAYCNAHPEEAHRVNVSGSIHVARQAEKIGARLIFLSTEQVFNGNEESGPYDENSVPFPDTVYGQNKYETERLLLARGDVWIPRLTWLFGLPEIGCGMSANILWDTMTALMRGRPILASPREYRGMTYVREVIDALPKLPELPCGVYHLGSSNDLSRLDVVRLILTEMGLKERIDEMVIPDETRYIDKPRDVRLCTKKVAGAGICFSDTSEGIAKCLSDYRIHL